MRKLACVLLISAMLLSLFGCEEQRPEGIPEETSAVTTEVTTTVTSPEIEVTEEPELPPRPAPAERNWNVVEISEGAEFIDFEYQRDYYGVKNRTGVKEKAKLAEKTVREDKLYIADMNTIKNAYAEKLADYEKRHGKAEPAFREIFTDDYDGDGMEESFVFVEAMSAFNKDRPTTRFYLVFIDSKNNAETVSSFVYIDEVSLLDYGKNNRQLLIREPDYYNGETQRRCTIVGVRDGKFVMLYDVEVSFVSKYGCFLKTYGGRVRGDFMYFDTVAGEYRVIMGERRDADEVFAMDKTNAFNYFRRAYEENDYLEVEQFGDCYAVASDENNYSHNFTYKDRIFLPGGCFAMSGNTFGLNAVKNIYIDSAISCMKKPEKVVSESSLESKFIDFEFINDYPGIFDRRSVKEIADAAEEVVLKDEDYISDINYMKETYPERLAEFEKTHGEIKPEFFAAFPEDYDGDGKEEAFVIVSAVYYIDEYYSINDDYRNGYFLLFVDSENNAEIVSRFGTVYEISMFNYGKYKQFIMSGGEGAGDHTDVFGVKDGKPVELYTIKGGFEKHGCFVTVWGWQGSGDFMYFDIEDFEYKAILGKLLDREKTFAMDKTGSLLRDDYFNVRLFGNKYYNFSTGISDMNYTYENGRFVPAYDVGIRRSEYTDLATVDDIDIDKALAEMVKPSEYASKPEPEENPYIPETEIVEVSEGNEFIDFEYIKNYRGITDREKVKAIAEVAEKAVAESGKVEECLEWVGGFEEEIRAYLKEHKDSKPKFLEAFIEDYDGDGNNEAFVMVDGVPGFEEPGLIAILVFVDHNNNAQIVDEFFGYSNGYDGYASLLNYGKNKQLVIESCGTMGANEHTAIWGMKNGKPIELYNFRGDFEKHDCFLTGYGWGSQGDFMYFDTVALEYRPIVGIKLNADDVYAMDKTGSLDLDRKEFRDVQLIGGKYYHFILNSIDQWGTTYYYENGKFVIANNLGIRRSGGLKAVVNIDIDKAIAEMKKPTEVK